MCYTSASPPGGYTGKFAGGRSFPWSFPKLLNILFLNIDVISERRLYLGLGLDFESLGVWAVPLATASIFVRKAITKHLTSSPPLRMQQSTLPSCPGLTAWVEEAGQAHFEFLEVHTLGSLLLTIARLSVHYTTVYA